METSLPQSTKAYILQYLLKNKRANANQIAQALDITPQAARKHLKNLEQEGLVCYDIIQPKIGRPQHEYYLSNNARDRFPQNYGEFALSFLDALRETIGENKVAQVLQKQWQRKAEMYRRSIRGATLKEKVTKLAEIRQKEGYMAELFCFNPHKFFLSEHNCAINEVAASYPQVCSHELEMFASLFPNCTVERTHWINNGEHRCGYLIEGK